MRTEFGFARSECACSDCQTNCRFMPGHLIPSDLERMIPKGMDPFAWALNNLLASPGALVVYHGEPMRIGTLVSAVKEDGSCKHLQNGRCMVHEIAPFGCAFFDCHDSPFDDTKSQAGLFEIMKAWSNQELYAQLWAFLAYNFKTQYSPDVLRKRIQRWHTTATTAGHHR